MKENKSQNLEVLGNCTSGYTDSKVLPVMNSLLSIHS